MQITMDRLVFDGVGPFQNREVFDLSERGITYVYAPNGHGKTSTIDLVRWLIQGKRALRDEALRSLRQDSERSIINHQCFRNMKGGSVTAILSVEGQGRYKVKRELAFGTDPDSKLTIHEEKGDDWTPIKEPQEFLATILPHERLGFNLLTGEHVQEFVEELSGPMVKASVEKLLRDPELVRVHDAVSNIAEELESKAQAEVRADKRRSRLLDKRAELKELKKNLDRQVREHENEEGKLAKEIEELNQHLTKLDSVKELKAERLEIKDALSTLEQRKDRELRNIRSLITPSWRSLLITAGSEAAGELIQRHEKATASLETWQRSMGQRDHLEHLLDEGACHCGDPLDEDARQGIKEQISELQATKPEIPSLPADEWTLRDWSRSDPASEFQEQLATHHSRLTEIQGDIEDRKARLSTIQETIEATDTSKGDMLKRRVNSRKRKIHALRDERSGLVSRSIDTGKELNKVKQKLADTGAEVVDGGLLSKANAYTEAFRLAIDRALPALQESLNERTQEIFSKLFQKETEYQVRITESSMVPHVVREIDGEEEHVLLSEGEKTRLGLALLFALREVASERPFLLLDAPFSTLDDEGIHRLLELIAMHEGQVIVFTKNAFPAGRWYDAILDADPTVYQMDWVKDGPRDREGHTELSKTEPEVLCIQEA